MAKQWIVESGDAHYNTSFFEDYIVSGHMPGKDESSPLDPTEAGIGWAIFEADTAEEALELAREWDEREFVVVGRDEACEARAEGCYRLIRAAVRNGWISEDCGLEMALHVVVNSPYLLHD